MHNAYHGFYVHKFGGTSVANADRFIAINELLNGKNEIIVVSAIKGSTTSLQNMLDAAKSGSSWLLELDAIKKLHLDIIHRLLPENRELINLIEDNISEIKNILNAVELTRIYSKHFQDIILGYGEIWSARILAAFLSSLNKKVLYVDVSDILFIHDKNGMICVDWNKSRSALNKALENISCDQIVIPGFIASTLDGIRTTLGRNGSDFSAGIFAKLFQSKCLTIWTDVDGIYSADPNDVRSAFVLDALSYHEALELAYFGAKVLHPMTIAPVLDANIPLYIKNSFNPQCKGTLISHAASSSVWPVKGLACMNNISLINIEGAGIIGVSGVATRLFQVLHQENISVIFIAQASSEHSICLAVSDVQASKAIAALKEYFQFEMDNGKIAGIYHDSSCAILSAIGDGMAGKVGISGKLFHALAQANINIKAISQGSSERNISVVVNKEDASKALQVVHAAFYLSRKTISIGLIGPGQVGKTLLKQICEEVNQLKSSNVNLFVRGIMSRDKMLLSHQPIALQDWQQQLDVCVLPPHLDEFANHILADDVPHAVIIDCTANQQIANAYAGFIEKGIHVITPNKHANAGNLDYYKSIRSLAHGKSISYLYEATVCAGLPVINTLQDLIKTGDEVHRIEGVVSGTLSYIFNALAQGKLFSDAVLEAKQLGYTEPDPREDLSGMDVARKLVCLAREIGLDISLEDVSVTDLVPAELKSCSVDEFMEKLPLYDYHMQDIATKACMNNERLCYAGEINSDGSIQVAIKSIQQSHPFARLKGTDNMLIFYTRRYHEQPLVIQGPGAGAQVIAAGIFADLLRLTSFLS